MPVGNRIRLGLGTLLVAAALMPATAWAHNGVGAAFKGPAGPYTVYAYDGYVLPNQQLEYRLVLLDRSSGNPVEDVRVGVTAHPLGAAAPTEAAHVSVLANVVLYDLPNPYPHDWAVNVVLRGRLGSARTAFNMHGQAPYVPADIPSTQPSGPNGAAIAGGAAAGAAVLAGATWFVVRRRRRGGLSRRSAAHPSL